MQDPRLADHAVGLELQLAELVEQRERARVQGQNAEDARLQQLIDAVQAELAQTAEQLAQAPGRSEVHDAVPARESAVG